MRRAALAWDVLFGVAALVCLVLAVWHAATGHPLPALAWAALAKVTNEMGGVSR